MKSFIASLLLASAFSAHSANVSTTVARVEFENNASCSKAGESLFNLCSGSFPRMGESSVPYTCIYTAKYDCISNSGDFKLKLRVKSSYNRHTYLRETRVSKVTIKR